MSYLLMKDKKINQLLPARVVTDPRLAQSILQPMRWRILSELSREEKCARDLASKFRTSEQLICYHLRDLEKFGLITLERTERIRGAIAKYYKAEAKAIAVVPEDFPGKIPILNPISLADSASKLLNPFISQGRFNGYIVLGSPDTHGIFRSRARCGDRATDLALFIGSLLPLTRESVVRLDTEISQHELSSNLITVGGPKVNTLTLSVNESLSITYELTGQSLMISRISGKSYAGEDEGAIQMIVNPNDQNSRVLVIAGNTYLGTRAAVLAFVKYTNEVATGNSLNNNVIARVVRGHDVNSDGLVDDVEFLE